MRLLADTQSSAESPRKQAELQLQHLYSDQNFPIALLSVASHDSVQLDIRQAALLYLKTYVLSVWSPQFDEFKGQVLVDNDTKRKLRCSLLQLATNEGEDRKIKSAAALVVSKIANADFPEDWPDLLDNLLGIIKQGSDGQIHGALKVLGELVDDCLADETFFSVARDLVETIYNVAVNEGRKATLRALAVNVFRACFDILEMLMDNHKEAVKGFADQALNAWIPFFVGTMKAPLPPPPSEDEELQHSPTVEAYRGLVALKLQVVKVLMRIRSVLPSTLSPHSLNLFSSTWDELTALQASYHQLYIEDERQSRLEDADGLPYTLDFLVLEELDFMQACLRAPPVRKELEQQLQSQGGGATTWVTEVMKLAVAYAQKRKASGMSMSIFSFRKRPV